MIHLVLKRETFTNKSTIGSLFIDGIFFCYTLEDLDRGLLQTMDIKEIEEKKVYGKTAIPKGIYEVAITYSNKFKQLMPLVMNVKGYSGIRIHKGNTDSDSLGCILVGMVKSNDMISQSTIAYNKLFNILSTAAMKGKIILTIE